MSQPLKIRFATDVEGAKQGMANLAASVANNALQMATALKTANDNVQRLQSVMRAFPAARTAFVGLAGAAVAVAAGVSLATSAIDQANAQLDRFIKLGADAERAGVGVEFFQRFSEAAKAAKIDVAEIEAALKKAGQTVTPKFEQEDPIRKRLNELFESGYTGSFQSRGLASYNSANSNEERIRAAVTAMQELRDLGLQVAAIDLAEKLFGADTADRIRSGRLEIEAIATALDRQRDDLITQEQVAQAAEFRERLAEAYKTIDDFLHVSVALEGSGRALQEVWLGIAEGVAKATINAGNFYTKIQEMQGPLANYLKTVGLIVSGTAQIIGGNLNDQVTGTRTLYDKPIGPERPGAPPNALTGAPLPPRRPLDTFTNPEKYGIGAKPSGGAAKTSPTESLNQVESFVNGLERSTAAVKAEMEAIGKNNAERQIAINLAKAQEIAKQNGITLTEAETKRIQEASRASIEYRDKIEDVRDRQDQLRSVGSSVFQGIAGDIRNGVSAATLFLGILDRMGQKILDIGVSSLTDSLFGKAGSTEGGPLTKAFSSLLGSFGGGRAGGGDLQAGQWALVGEKGPELIGAASMARTVIPNGGKLVSAAASPSGGGTMSYTNSPTYNITPASGVTIPQLQAAFAQHDRELTRTFGQRFEEWRARH